VLKKVKKFLSGKG
jgi:molecular chaperone DnaK (HSP70)